MTLLLTRFGPRDKIRRRFDITSTTSLISSHLIGADSRVQISPEI